MTSIDQPHHVDGLESLSTADPFVIAEIGVNHDGDPARAEALVDAAAEAGADAVKFQWFEPRRLLSRSARLAAYQAAAGEHDPITMLERLRLDADGLERARLRAATTDSGPWSPSSPPNW